MAALTSADWTVAILERRIENGVRVNRCSMTLATVGTYPSGGIPIPTARGTWGMVRSFDRIVIYDDAQGLGQLIKYAATGQVLRIYQDRAVVSGVVTMTQADFAEMATTATAGTGGSTILYVHAYGW